MAKNHQDTYRDDRISVVEISSKWFGVNILKSREVIPLPPITPVPNTSDFVLGVFNLRGEIYSLVDIATILGMDPKAIRINDMVILISSREMTIGIPVDRIHGVRSLDNVPVKPAHGVVSKQMEEFVTGVIPEKNSYIYLLDIERLFSSQAISAYY